MADYCIWNLCNSNCIMCTNPYGFRTKKGAKAYSADKVLQRITGDKNEILRTEADINLTGGEPTIHPEFVYLMENLRKRFPKNAIAFSTNGRRFMYKGFAKKILSINNIRMHVVIHSASKEIHDSITRSPGSFEQTVKGLENLFKYRNRTHSIEIRTVLLKQNYSSINDLYRMLHNKFTDAERICTIFPEYEGRAEKNFEEISVSFPQVKPFVEKGLKNWRKKFKSFYLYHFPLCAVRNDFWEHVIRSLPPDHHETFFMEKCEKCFYKDSCLGVYKDYVRHFGEDHFKPISDKIKGIKKNHEDYHRPIVRV